MESSTGNEPEDTSDPGAAQTRLFGKVSWQDERCQMALDKSGWTGSEGAENKSTGTQGLRAALRPMEGAVVLSTCECLLSSHEEKLYDILNEWHRRNLSPLCVINKNVSPRAGVALVGFGWPSLK